MSSGQQVRGSCFCGEVRFTVTMPSLFCVHCHCSMCRRTHGAAFVTWFSVPSDQLALETPDALVRRASSDHGARSACGRCGTPLFFESTHRPDQVDVVLSNMHGPIDREPQMHVFFDDRAAWTRVADGLPRLGGATGLEPIEPADGSTR